MFLEPMYRTLPFSLAAGWARGNAFCVCLEAQPNGQTDQRKQDQSAAFPLVKALIYILILSLDTQFHTTLRNINFLKAVMFCQIVLKWAKNWCRKQQEDLTDRETKRNCMIFIPVGTQADVMCFILAVHSEQ